jgi:hypothetical protein
MFWNSLCVSSTMLVAFWSTLLPIFLRRSSNSLKRSSVFLSMISASHLTASLMSCCCARVAAPSGAWSSSRSLRRSGGLF